MSAIHAAGGDRISPRNFRRLAQFIEDYCGIRMPPSKQTMVEGRLRRRAKDHGDCTLDEYCAMLFENGALAEEAVDLIDAITTNKTEFFREPDHFRLLVEHVLPAMLRRPDRPGLERPLQVWSAACSTGAEPYTLAMQLDDFAQHQRGFRFQVVATDICTDVLAKAKLAVYPAEMAKPVPPAYRERYFLQSRDPSDTTVRIIPRIRSMVRFGRLNLMDSDYPVGTMDIVFCRNILIYFDKATQLAVLQRISRQLSPGGFLFVGHSEAVLGKELPLTPVASALFQRN